jgi:hypothetical protein
MQPRQPPCLLNPLVQELEQLEAQLAAGEMAEQRRRLVAGLAGQLGAQVARLQADLLAKKRDLGRHSMVSEG